MPDFWTRHKERLGAIASAATVAGLLVALGTVGWQIYAARDESRIDRAISYCERFRKDDVILKASEYTGDVWLRFLKAAPELGSKNPTKNETIELSNQLIEKYERSEVDEVILPGPTEGLAEPTYVNFRKFTEILNYYSTAIDFIEEDVLSDAVIRGCLSVHMASFIEKFYHRVTLFTKDDPVLDKIRGFLIKDDRNPSEIYYLATTYYWDNFENRHSRRR